MENPVSKDETPAHADPMPEDSIYRLIFQDIQEGLAIHRIEVDRNGRMVDYRILEVNPVFEVHTGLKAAEVRGRLGSEVFQTDPPPFIEEFSRTIQEKRSLRFEGFIAHLKRHFLISVVYLKPGCFATLFLDQTEQKILQAENDNIFQNSVDCICIADLSGWFLKVNPAWSSVLGWSAEELKSRPYLELVHPEDREATIGLKALESPYTALEGFENRYRCKDGTYRWLAWSAFMTEDRVYAVARDVTRAKNSTRQLEDLLAKTGEQLQARENLTFLGSQVAGIAHEVMNPLGMAVTTAGFQIDTTSHLLALLENPEAQLSRQQLQTALVDIKDAASLVQHNLERATEILGSFKQLAVDRTSGLKRKFRLSVLLDQVVLSMKPRFKPAGISCQVTCAPDIEAQSYPGILVQVLTNLLLNAQIHGFGQKSEGLIKIRARILQDRKGWAEVEVEDNGKGIPSGNRTQVFEPFFTTLEGEGGSGLGLAIVRSLVTRRLGGEVWMESHTEEDGQGPSGTIFHILFPLDV